MTWREGGMTHRWRTIVSDGRDVVAWLGSGPVDANAAPAPDQDDFEAQALSHAGSLYRTAYHLTGSAFEAEDLTQETYLRAYRGFAAFRGGDIRAWLFAILRHAFLDECRRRGRGLAIATAVDPAAVLDGPRGQWAPSAESEALRRLPSEAIERAFGALPPDWRMIVLLADVEELSYREIAGVMGVPIGTVMSRLHRARKRLQDELLGSPQPGVTRSERSA
jgi:RNA polymerase sigma-70 factor (ECF subfamily)